MIGVLALRFQMLWKPEMIIGLLLMLAGTAAGGLENSAFAARKADGLLALTPPESSATVVLEDFGTRFKAIRESTPVKSLQTVPAVKRWLESEGFQSVRQAVVFLESALKCDLRTFTEQILGEAVVLSLCLPEEGEGGSPRGLLLLKVKDRHLLEQVIVRLNASQETSGELVKLTAQNHKGIPYKQRLFRNGSKAPEWYAVIGPDIFAWSNSEVSIRQVIDRQTDTTGLSSDPSFQGVRRHLPESAFLSLFVNPRSIDRALQASAPPQKTEEARVFAWITGYVKALKFAAVGVDWNNGPVLHLEESIDPEKLPPEMRSWGAVRTPKSSVSLTKVPDSAFAIANVWIDSSSMMTLFEQLAFTDSPNRLKNLWIALDGLSMGLNVRTEVIGRLGPEAVAYIETPESRSGRPWEWPAVLEIPLPSEDSMKAATAAVNALRTILAIVALDEKRLAEKLVVETKTIDGVAVTFLGPLGKPAFAANSERLVIATSPDAAARAFAAASDQHSGARVQKLRSRFEAIEASYAVVDLSAFHNFADPKRSQLAKAIAARGKRSESEVSRDLGEILQLIAPFEVLFATSRIEPGFVRVHRTIGVLAPESSTP